MKKESIITRIKNGIVRNPLITLMCMAIGVITASVYLYLTPAQYESSSVIESVKIPGTTLAHAIFSSGKTAATEEITSIPFLTEALKGKVDPISYYIEQDFQKRFNAYGFPFIIKYSAINTNFKEQHYTIQTTGDNTFILSSTIHGIKRSKNGNFGEELIDMDLALTVSKNKSTPYKSEELIQAPRYSFRIQSPESLAAELINMNKGINVTDENGVITMTSRHESPVIAKQITTALTEYYLEPKVHKVGQITQKTGTIDEQLAVMATQMETVEDQIAVYKKENNITDIRYDTERTMDILKTLQIQKAELEINLAALNNTSNYLRKNRGTNNSNVEYGSISDPVFSEQIALLTSKYKSKENGTANASTDNEIEAIKTTIAERILNTRKKTTIQISRINQEIASLNNQLSKITEKAGALQILDRKLSLDKKVYELLAEQRAQAIVTGNGITGNGKILKPASDPVQATFPGIWLVIAAGILSGLLIAVPINIIAQTVQSRKLANRQAVDKETRIPFFGSIAQNNESGSSLEQSISVLSTRVLLREETKIITFASTNKGEGKTFIATRFAQAFAAMDKKVLVIDMNSKCPEVATHFNVTPERSLANVLNGDCDIHDAICITSYPNLDVLECGNLNGGVNTLLASDKRSAIIASLKQHYDIIVTDTPDIGTQIDAIPLMKMSDLNLFVVNANTTRKNSLLMAEQVNKDYELSNLFLLLNSVKQNQINYPGSNRRSRVRNLNKTKNTPKEAYVPTMLRKIALWFY